MHYLALFYDGTFSNDACPRRCYVAVDHRCEGMSAMVGVVGGVRPLDDGPGDGVLGL
jgi:hypothetical protein